VADKKISGLTELTQAAPLDVLVIVDDSEPDVDLKTKKITKTNLMATPGPIGGTTPDVGSFTTLHVQDGVAITEFSSDGTLNGDSNSVLPTEKAVKTYVDNVSFSGNDDDTLGGGTPSHIDAPTQYAAKTYIDIGDAGVSIDATTYTDAKLVEAEAYADSKDSIVSTDATTYTDAKLVEAEAYADSKDSIVSTDATTYTDAKLVEAENYTDTQVAPKADYLGNVSRERTGFPTRDDSTISFDDVTQSFTISGTFDYYIWGIKYSISGSRSAAVQGSGTNFFYLDTTGNLIATNTFNLNTIYKDNAYVAVVYWDHINNKHIYLGDERHSIWWDWNLHYQQHKTVGTRYEEGLGLTDIVAYGLHENIYNADDTLFTLSNIVGNHFAVSALQNHTPGGTNSLNFTETKDLDVAQLLRPSGEEDLSDYNDLEGWIYITAWAGTEDFNIYGWDTVSGTQVGIQVALSSYINTGTLNSWQKFSIPLSDMNLDGETIDAIRIIAYKGNQANPPDGFLDDLIFNGIGSELDSDLEFGVEHGIIWDEDLKHSISTITKGESKFAVFHRQSDGTWTNDGTSSVIVKQYQDSTSFLAYNYFDGTTWTQAEVSNGSYILAHLFATNDPEFPLIGIQTQSLPHSTIQSARAAINTEIASLVTEDLPFQEMITVASLIIENDSEFSNKYKARFVYINSAHTQTWEDFRTLKGSSIGASNVSDHGQLTGLLDDDHPQYFNKTRGDARYFQKSSLKNGIVDLTSGDTTADITFSTNEQDMEYKINIQLRNETDFPPDTYNWTIYGRSLSGFSVYFSAPISSDNYVLEWCVIRGG